MANGLNMKIAFNSEEFQSALLQQVVAVDAASEHIVRQGGEYIGRLAKLNFMPGKHTAPHPNTFPHGGTPPVLRNSITTANVVQLEPGRWSSMTGGTTKYARRLELGFTGTDSAGRNFGPPNNPAKYPYLAPAVREARKGLKEIYELEWEAALRR